MEELSIAQRLIDNYHLIQFLSNREICEIFEKEVESHELEMEYLDEIKELPTYVHNEYTAQIKIAKMRYLYSFDTCLDDLKDAVSEIVSRSVEDVKSRTQICHVWSAQKHLEKIADIHRRQIFGILDNLFETVYAEDVCSSIIMRIKKMYVRDLGGTIYINNHDLAAMVFKATHGHEDKLKSYAHLDPRNSQYIMGVIETIGPGIYEAHPEIPLMALTAAITLLCRIGFVNQSIGISFR